MKKFLDISGLFKFYKKLFERFYSKHNDLYIDGNMFITPTDDYPFADGVAGIEVNSEYDNVMVTAKHSTGTEISLLASKNADEQGLYCGNFGGGKFLISAKDGQVKLQTNPYVQINLSDVSRNTFLAGPAEGSDNGNIRVRSLTKYDLPNEYFSNSTISDIIAVNTANATFVYAEMRTYGRVANCYFQFKTVNDIAVPVSGNISDVQIGTVVTQYRPATFEVLVSSGNNGGLAFLSFSTTGPLQISALRPSTAAYTLAAGSSFSIAGTYILAATS